MSDLAIETRLVSSLAIETRRLRKSFGNKVAVRDLSLAVPRGEVVGFIGPNGAGKTTSMKMLLGLVRPTSGRGALLGATLGNVAVRRHVGFLPEHFRFHEWLSGRELLRLHGRLLGLEGAALSAQVDALLARVQLDEAASRRVRDYSKGMQQRLGLAQALLNDPQLVFLDEPTSGLDPLGRLLVRSVIEELRARGTTVFLNSHLLSEVERTCDRVVFIKAGCVIRDMLLAAEDKAFEAALRVDRIAPAVVQRLAQRVQRVEQDSLVLYLTLSSQEQLPEITRWLASEGVGLYHLASRRPSLETVFVELMQGEGASGPSADGHPVASFAGTRQEPST